MTDPVQQTIEVKIEIPDVTLDGALHLPLGDEIKSKIIRHIAESIAKEAAAAGTPEGAFNENWHDHYIADWWEEIPDWWAEIPSSWERRPPGAV